MHLIPKLRPGWPPLASLALALALTGCYSVDPLAGLHSIYVERLSLDGRTDTPVVLLRESDGQGRELPIWIGMAEAQSIAVAMEDVELPRPNTHDLIKNLLDELQGDILRVIITELRGHTYYAVIDVRLNGRSFIVDSRPSDAIAVAIRTSAPLFATEDVLMPETESLDEDQEPPLDIEWKRPDTQLHENLRSH
jgi:bifunctional DNase/RNase